MKMRELPKLIGVAAGIAIFWVVTSRYGDFLIFRWRYHNDPRDPYHCYIVHHLKDGSCPEHHWVKRDWFTEWDGTKDYACFDTSGDPNRVGLAKERCTDYLKPGEQEEVESIAY